MWDYYILTWPLSFCRLGLHGFCKITCIWSSDCTVPVKATLLSCSVDATSPSFRTFDLCPTLFPLTYISAEQAHLHLWWLAGVAILVEGERETVNFFARILRYNGIIAEHDSGRVHVATAYVQVI